MGITKTIHSNQAKSYHNGRCYMCHKKIITPHFSNSRLCAKCGTINYEKRCELSDLHGRIAIVTGGRIKIGFQTSLKLLRSGAFVIVTTRFPIAAAIEYSKENDFENWKEKLRIYKVDFRNIYQIEKFTNFLNSNLTHLDIIINNAAQTIKHHVTFFESLREIETTNYSKLPERIRKLIYNQTQEFDFFKFQDEIDNIEVKKIYNVKMLSFEDKEHISLNKIPDNTIIQSINDHHNSWISRAHEVSEVELLEVQLVNVTAPYILNTKLRYLLLLSPFREKFIINVSAMEGKFNRVKNIYHPHTNMAKASLNMFTRTVADDYKDEGIYINSVDTGWITDENPENIKFENYKKNITPPIDEIDGASRICDPIFYGIKTGRYSYGRFFKDYHTTSW
ncbi:MAG: SDR family NAD(P)-dependent oxidoreductase [Ignavibacteriaceae bacterium]